MAKISALPLAAALDGSELMPIVKDGVTQRALLAPVIEAAASSAIIRAETAANKADQSASFSEEFSGPARSTIAEGEAATTPGHFFRVPIAGTNPVEYKRYERTAGGSVEVAPLATTAALAAPTGAALVGTQFGNAVDTAQKAFNVLRATRRPAMDGIFSSGADQRAALQAFVSASAAEGKTIEWGPIDLALNVEVGAENMKGLLVPSGSRWVGHPNMAVRAVPTSAPAYQIINLFGVSDVVIEGCGGRIFGEKNSHTGSTGEFGMGLSIRGSKRVTIKELSVEDCWGDGWYLGSDNEANRTPCEDIHLVRIVARNNRRTGLAVINAKNLSVMSSKFLSTGGTPLHAGVDLEPNNIAEAIINAHFYDCDFEDNIGPGLMTAGPVANSYGLFVTACRFKRNSHNFASTIPNTQVTFCDADGSTGTTSDVGGFTIDDGKVSDCTTRNMRRTGYGATGSGNAKFLNNVSEYRGSTTQEDTGLYVNKTGGELAARGNDFGARAQAVRGQGTVSYLELIDNTFTRYQTGAFGSAFPLHLSSLAVAGRAFIEGNRFPIPAGSAIDGPIMALHPDANYLIENNKMEGWNRNSSNWLSQAAGTGSVKYGAGNILPNGTFDRPVGWQAPFYINGYALWVEGSGKLRIKSSAPISDTDGVVVGTQT